MWHSEMPEEYKNAIITGDARVLAEQIPDESVDLIFTDPVYDRIEDYAWLAETAARVLREDSAVLVWSFISHLPFVMDAMRAGGLTYRWQAILYYQGRVKPQPGDMGYCNYAPLLWFEAHRLGRRKTRDLIGCMPFVDKLPVAKNIWDWSKPVDPLAEWLTAFAQPDAIVFDPFTGGGTVPAVCKMLNRNYIAFEIDPATAERARERVAYTQAMHPVLLGVQEPMELAV